MYDGDEALQVRVPVKAGLRRVVATMLKSEDAEPEGAGPDRIPTWSRESDNAAAPTAISSLLVGGPYDATSAARFAQPAAHFRVPARTK